MAPKRAASERPTKAAASSSAKTAAAKPRGRPAGVKKETTEKKPAASKKATETKKPEAKANTSKKRKAEADVEEKAPAKKQKQAVETKKTKTTTKVLVRWLNIRVTCYDSLIFSHLTSTWCWVANLMIRDFFGRGVRFVWFCCIFFFFTLWIFYFDFLFNKAREAAVFVWWNVHVDVWWIYWILHQLILDIGLFYFINLTYYY